jgi:hypothetical protein
MRSPHPLPVSPPGYARSKLADEEAAEVMAHAIIQ